MVIVNFKLTDIGRLEIDVAEPQTLAYLLQQVGRRAGLDPDSVIAICRGKVLSKDSLVENGDEIDVFPAISGG